jgi:carboxymethylenebutenolidase
MGTILQLEMTDSIALPVYHATPDGDRRGGLVLIQEIFGVFEGYKI